MTTEEKIDELKRQLAEIEVEVKAKNKPAKVMGQYRPAEGYEHWFISDYGEVHHSTKQGELERHLSLGNSFETREEAKLALEFRKLCVPTDPMPTGRCGLVYTDVYLKFCVTAYDTNDILIDYLRYKLGILGTDKDRLQKLCDLLNEHPEFLQ